MTGILLTLITLLATTCYAKPLEFTLARRAVITDASRVTGETYDYIIVGGGTSGLALAARLSEDSDNQVLVVEAGGDGSVVAERINAPAMAYYNGIAYPGSDYDWSFQTTNQSGLNDRSIFWPRGKVLGGSSAVNGAYMTRASKVEYDAWNSLQTDGLVDWSWDSIYPYQTKAETFDRPSAAYVNATDVTFNISNHGRDGPIHYGFPDFGFPQISLWGPTWNNLNVSANNDAYGGNTLGSRVSASCINSANWTRSYSASGYLWPNIERPNLTVLSGYTVTSINWEARNATADTTRSSGITFTTSRGAESFSVNTTTTGEVILSAGVIGSPQLLQVSGVGPRTLLERNNIEVVVDLPGVGAHLSDHLSGQIAFSADVSISGDEIRDNSTFAAQQLAQFNAGDGGLYSAPNNAIAYVDLATLFEGQSGANAFIEDVRGNLAAQLSAHTGDETVKAGFSALYELEIALLNASVGAAEILMTNTGYADGSQSTVIIQAAIQRGLSKGSVQIQSSNIFDAPTIDPGYFTNPTDVVLHRQAFKLARILGATAPLSSIINNEISPGSAVSSDAQWESWIQGVASTEYHPAGSASLLPLALGGCVATDLKVYGTSNVRVVDTSIIPVSFAAHLTDPAYLIGEYAAAIILGQTESRNSSSASRNTTTSTPTNATDAAQNAEEDAAKSSAFTSFDPVLSLLSATALIAACL